MLILKNNQKNHYMCVNSYPTTYQLNKKNFLFLHFFNYCWCCWHLYFIISPWIFIKIWKDPKCILRGPEETYSWKKPELKNLGSDSLFIVQDPLERPSMNSCDGISDSVVQQLEAILQLPSFKEKSEQPIIFFVDGKNK